MPPSYDAVTLEWLADVLKDVLDGAELSGFRLGAVDDGTANRRRIYLEYKSGGSQASPPESVFCKASHDLLHRLVLGLTGGAHAEVTFQNKVRPKLDIEAPRAIFAAYDPQSYCSIVVMHDIGGEAQFCDEETSISRIEVEAQLALLAKLHSTDFGASGRLAQSGLITWPEFFSNVVDLGQSVSSNLGFLAAESVIPARLFRNADRVWPATVASVEDHLGRPHSHLHGDCHLKQWYKTLDGQMGLTDWQCATVGNWSRDVAYCLGTSLEIADRRIWERDILDFYADQMAENGALLGSRDERWALYRRNMMSALNWWTGTLVPAPGMPEMQPKKTTLKFIERLATSADDLSSIEACLGG